jgi:beta-lactamase class C
MKYILLIFLNLCVVYLNGASANPSIPPQIQNFIQQVESQQKTLQGGAIAILHKDKVIYKKTFGFQKEYKEPITSHTLFPIASVSKSVSAVALALMADKGNLNFNKKYKISYLQNDVSLKDLLSHTTGYYFSGNTQIEKGLSRQALLAELKKQTPQCLPGKCYFYSNATYSLVEDALNIEGLKLQTAFHHLQKALNTKQIQILPLTSNISVAYPHNNQKALPFPRYYPTAVPAAAGVFASLEGLIEFYKLSFGYRPDLISQKTLNTLYQPVARTHDMEKWNINFPVNLRDIEAFYGLGWRIIYDKHYPNKKLIFHSGMISGVRAYIGFMPNEEYGIIILANQNTALPLENGLQFWKTFLS